ncbi:glycosyltransferase family 4 protein [Streptomyces chiangmaiensis]|uniref:D-inositol 3-phosphate glycosyltransferase n=1 Tax=Streptomyces chiangmaiensis TaxID=766497 RepID=A0ABU7FB63_9ACTN|nr:glycosyltransferase family 4 protein [Streptomyces chiangmaiensis]MED7821427.1 glycosyltransferase family 4 protein [Streptomyces chiangmaiensis]
MTQREIFFVANEVNELGGVGRWQAQMARLFVERGHRVRIIGIAPPELAMDLGDDPPFETLTLYDRRPPGRRRPRVPFGRFDPSLRRREADMHAAAERLSRLFLAAPSGAVIIVTQVWAMEWVALADTAGHPVIGMSHESFGASRRSSRFARVQRYYQDVDRLLVLTQEDADLWVAQGLNNVGFMPNPLPVTPGAPSPRTEKVVASIGRLSHAKGVDLLLDVWAEAAPRQPGWILRIYGAGEHESLLRQQCTELGLDDSVEWAGQTGDVTAALGRSSVFVQSSRGEGFPLVLLEAMACGVPCAAFDCSPGVREIVSDGEDGLLARHGNTAELARQLVRLMSDENLRDTMGDKARQNVRRFAPDVITRRWEELFDFLER